MFAPQFLLGGVSSIAGFGGDGSPLATPLADVGELTMPDTPTSVGRRPVVVMVSPSHTRLLLGFEGNLATGCALIYVSCEGKFESDRKLTRWFSQGRGASSFVEGK